MFSDLTMETFRVVDVPNHNKITQVSPLKKVDWRKINIHFILHSGSTAVYHQKDSFKMQCLLQRRHKHTKHTNTQTNKMNNWPSSYKRKGMNSQWNI